MGIMKSAVAAVYNASGKFLSQSGTPNSGDDFWYNPVGMDNHSGVRITPDIALKASAVYACVKVLAETMGSLPLRMYRELPGGGREEASNHPLDELLRFQPNQTQTAVDFWEMMMLHAALRGGAYAEIIPGARGAVDQLLPLHTDRVTPERMRDGSLRFKVADPRNGMTRVLLQEEVFRVPGLSSDGISGLRAIDLASEDIGLGMAADAYASRVFSNKLNIGGFLIHPKTLSNEAQKGLVQALMERFAGINNTHRPIVLQEGMKFERAMMDAKDAQLLEARKWQTILVAQRFRVPLHMLSIDDQTNRSTVEAQAIDFVKYTLRPWVKRIEQAIRRDLIVAKGTYVAKFNLEGLLRGDSAARANYFGAALGSSGRAAWMTPNEVRAIEGMNPSDDPRANLLGGMAESSPANMAVTDNTPNGRADRLIRKEVAAIRKSSMRLADNPDGFRQWVTAFYGGHCSFVMETLDIPKDAARVYCDFQRDECLAANNIETMLTRWEEDKAAEIAATLEKRNEQ